MDPSEPRPSPRRELQGPRPAPLRVSRESRKIKKPPVAPHHRDPVVIYTVSPKIIHANPSEFMSVVQKLTGPGSDPSGEPSLPSPGGALSPAARIATFEKAVSPQASDLYRARTCAVDGFEIEGEATVDRPASFPGILSPVPASLLPISPNLFSPSLDPSVLGFLLELSPVLANKSFMDGGSFLASPSNNLLSTPTVPSPGAFWELLNQFPDL
ncbi:VQ domain containing protein [Musa troglodytarum]|uniref:VQ domain containing protein n=1 Tax=Musa troglodytarum TaxID=320322 RepID=A0A9E7GIU2_9LILI|nr:VQ domain containing protein [Musa troglodytarum]